MAARRPYERPVAGWWARNPRFRAYMLREATCALVAAYALILVVGLVRLAQGREAFEGYVAMLRTPVSLAVHAVLFAAFAYHAWSWFSIMPKTMAPLAVAGRRVAPWAITAAGLAAAIACSTGFVVLVAALAR